MLANMSFKLKLIALFVSAITGFVILTFVALDGLNMLNEANAKQKVFSNLQLSTEHDYVGMIRLSDQLQVLDENTAQSFVALIQEREMSLNLESDKVAKGIYSDAMIDQLNQGRILSLNYYQELKELVLAKQALGFSQTTGLKASVSTLSEQIHGQIKSVSFVLAKFDVMNKKAVSYQLDSSPENLEVFVKSYDDYFSRLKNFGLLKKFGELPPLFLQAVKDYGSANVQLENLNQGFILTKKALDEQRDAISIMLAEQVKKAEKASSEQSQTASFSLIIASLVIAAFASIILFAIVKSVKSNLKHLSVDLAKVQAGDLTARARINTKRNDEFDELATSLNGMTDGLGHVISNVVLTSQDVNAMVKELDNAVAHISDSNGSISNQTSTLATATEEISQSVSSVFSVTQDMKEQVQQTYESAQNGSKTIKEVLGNLGETVSIVGETSAQLDELGKLSADIDGVIGMINELAGQTNLLALNAAIEAARAGDAGRGFSVVADEVRSLASKTVDATSQISSIVGNIQTATKAAIDKMASSQDNLDAIEKFSEQAEIAMHDIESSAHKGSSASIEMAASIEQVAQTTTTMSQDMEQIATQLKNDTGAINRIEDNARNISGKVSYLAEQAEVFTV